MKVKLTWSFAKGELDTKTMKLISLPGRANRNEVDADLCIADGSKKIGSSEKPNNCKKFGIKGYENVVIHDGNAQGGILKDAQGDDFNERRLAMRTIKFRGKSLETDDWVYGFLADGNLICTWDNRVNCHEVLSITVGQFTGLLDKNGKEIYEGDIVAEGAFKRVISFIPEAAAFCSCSPYESSIRTRTSADEMRFYEVIGNIHDNPDLMKGGKEC